MSIRLTLFLALTLAACGGESPDKHVVMVIDRGFDLQHPVFDGKVVATYSQVCEPAPARDLVDLVLPDFEVLSAERDCRLEEGLPDDISPRFSGVLPDRERWNQDIRGKSVGRRFQGDKAAFDDVVSVITGEEGAYIYHGTATAGLVAYENENVELVLVASSSIASTMTLDMLACPTQGEIQARVETLTDPDNMDALANAPVSALSREIQDVAERHRVSMINASFGSLAREGLEDIFAARGCPGLDLIPYYKARAAITTLRSASQESSDAAEPLLVRAAGNSGVQIDSLDDEHNCTRDGAELVVGALDAAGSRAGFSNHGACVDAYLLGEDVVVAAPAGFLSVSSGTSLSTPLMVRYLTLAFAPSDTPQQIREGLLASLAPDGALAGEPAPRELSATNAVPIGANQYALIPESPGTPDPKPPVSLFVADPLFSLQGR